MLVKFSLQFNSVIMIKKRFCNK